MERNISLNANIELATIFSKQVMVVMATEVMVSAVMAVMVLAVMVDMVDMASVWAVLAMALAMGMAFTKRRQENKTKAMFIYLF